MYVVIYFLVRKETVEEKVYFNFKNRKIATLMDCGDKTQIPFRMFL